MKKFISALSSLVIAATALGGTLAATPATAAINGNVDKTIFDIRSSKASSDNPNLVEAKAGDQIPYVVYIPQSSGFYLANLKFAINGDATKGQDPALCNDATKYTLKKDTQLGNKGEVIVHPEVFGNYGIKLAMNFCNPGCFVSGYMNENSMNAGKLKAQSAAIASGENWSSLIMSQKYLDEGKNLDSFNKFASEGGEQAMEDETAEEALYAKYQPAFTWTKDESWAYDYGYVEGTLTLPDNLPDGVYTFDVYTGGYIASQFLEDFKTYNEATGDYVDDPMNGKLNYVYTSLTDVDSKSVDFTSVPLKIKVGDTTETTTSTTGTTTTTSRGTSTSSSSKIDPSSGIVYDLVPAEGEYELKNGNNVVKVAKGATVTVNWIVNNDAEAVGGMEYTLDVSKVASVANTKVGKAYSAEPLINTDNAGEIVYTFSTMESLHAKDGAVIMKMDVTVPDKDGSYTIGLKTGGEYRAMTAGHDKGVSYDYTFHGITFEVGDVEETTTSSTATTTSTSKIDPSNGIVYDLVPAEGEYELKNGNNVVKVAKGATVTVNWIVNNDAEAVGGMEYTLDISKVASVANAKVGKAYSAEPLINTDNAGEIVYTFSTMESLHAKDGAVIMKMDVTVPDEEGSYTIGLKTGGEYRAMTAGHDKGVSYDYTFHGITFEVGDVETTTSTTTTTTTTTSTVTTSTETTTSTTETTIPDGEVLWGDSNCDKKVSIADVVLLNRHLAGTAKLSDQGAKNADVVFNGKLEPNDSKVIKGYLALFIDYKVLGNADSETTLDAAIAAQK